MGIANKIVKNTAFEFITNFFELGIAFIVGIILTRSLGTQQYGIYAYTIWLLGFAALGTNLGLGDMSRRFIPEAVGRESPLEPAGFVQLSFIVRTTAAVIVCLFMLLTSGYWVHASGSDANRMIFVVVALSVIPIAIQQTIVGAFKGFQKFNYSLYISLIIFPIRLILVLIFMSLNYGVMSVLLINIGTMCVGVVIGFIVLRKLVPLKTLFFHSLLSSERRKQALKYSMTIAGTMLLGYLLSQEAEIYFVGLFSSVENVGFFKLGYNINAIIAIFPSAFTFVLLPAITEQFGKGDVVKMKKIYNTSIRYLMFIAVPIAICVIALADTIITTLYGAEYSPAIVPFRIVSITIAIAGLAGPADSLIRSINRPGYIFFTSIIRALGNVGLSLALIPKYGILGAAIAVSVTNIIVLPFYTIFVLKQVKVTWPLGDTVKIVISSLIMGTIVYFLHNNLNNILSLVLGIPLGVIVYVTALFIFGVIRTEDVEIIKGLNNFMPLVLRKYYSPLVVLLERIVLRKELNENK